MKNAVLMSVKAKDSAHRLHPLRRLCLRKYYVQQELCSVFPNKRLFRSTNGMQSLYNIRLTKAKPSKRAETTVVLQTTIKPLNNATITHYFFTMSAFFIHP